MHGFVNKDNICSVEFDPATNPVDPNYHLPSISELVEEARKTGQMPYSTQRQAMPSYTDDIDAPLDFDGCDKVGQYQCAQRYVERVQALETELETSASASDPAPAPTTEPPAA